MKLSDLLSRTKVDKQAQVNTDRRRVPAGRDGAKPAAGPAADRVELSGASRDVQAMREILLQTPAVRAEKVRALKEQIAQGDYQVDAYKVADKMIKSLLSDSATND